MLALLVDAALRFSGMTLVVYLMVATLRIRNLQTQIFVWRLVLLAAVLMPLLLICLPRVAPGATLPGSMPLQTAVIDVVSGIEWPQLAAVIYFAVTATLLLREIINLRRGWQIYKHATPVASANGLRVRSSGELTAPATFASTILLPRGALDWTEAKRAAVMAHEATHVANQDFHVRHIARLYRAFFWFNPLAWVLARHLVLLEEHLSDAAGARTMADPASYADLLLSLTRDSSRSTSQVAMAHGMLTRRVERLLRDDEPHAPLSRRGRFAITLLAVPMITYAMAAGVDRAAYRCREPKDDRSTLVAAFDNCTAPASDPLLPLSLPPYPAGARRSGEQGTVILRLLVSADGSVKAARLKKSSGHRALDDSAVAGALQWRMAPGAVGKHPIDSWGMFAVTFRLAP